MTLPVAQACLAAADLERIRRAVAHVRTHDTDQVLADLLPDLTPDDRADVSRHLVFDHTAVLVFPDSLDGLRDELRRHDLEPGPVTPSVVVRGRLARRYGALLGDSPVGIVHVAVEGRSVEVFALPVPTGSPLRAVADDERTAEHEAHHAFALGSPGTVIPSGLRTLLQERGGAVPDGGGYNGHENVTVLYFRTRHHHRRFELRLPGRHEPLPDPAVSLLGVMTGAWATQAVATMAELRIADHLTDTPGLDTPALAARTATHPDALRRLLRYLTTLGLLTSTDGGHHLTALGQPLCTSAEFSLHPLALLYGGLFYDSFAGLTHAVRTGEEAFAHRHGQHHFAHLAERPELGALFHRAMAASAEMFTPVPQLVDFSAARQVVDVGGGNGALLGRLLRAHPHLEGVLLERPEALEAARHQLTERCTFVAGDFTRSVPRGGDVYLLSRVLHDWDDDRCLTILDRCAEAMRPGSRLLVVERLLPDRTATAWDIHMLCNVGGRERTEDHYRALLEKAGFAFTGCHALPLGASLMDTVRI